MKHQEIQISGNVRVLSSEHSARVSSGTGSWTDLKVPNMHGGKHWRLNMHADNERQERL